MRTLLKFLGYLLVIAFFFLMLADPKGAADLLVDTGSTAAGILESIGTFWAHIAEKLDQITNG